MNEFESDWISLRQSQIGVRVFWVNLRDDNKVSESKMAVSESNMTYYMMAAIIKLNQNEWVKFFFANGGNQSWQVWVSMRGKTKMAESKMWNSSWQIQDGCHHQVRWEWMSLSQIELSLSQSQIGVQNGWMQVSESHHHQVVLNEWRFFVQNGWMQDDRIQDGHHHQVESEWMSEVFFVQNGWMQDGPSSSWVSNKFEKDWVWVRLKVWVRVLCNNGRIKDGRIQDGCHHQVRWEWMSWSQIELVWFRIRVEWECFWVKLREDNKVSKSKMAVAESSMAEFKMAAIIKLRQNEWVKFILFKMVECKMAEFKMAAIIKVEWVWVRLNEFESEFCAKWVNSRWQNSRWLPSSSYVRRNEFESDWISLSQSQIGVRVFLSESERRWLTGWVRMCLNPTWQNSRWLPSSSWVRMNEWSFFCANGGNQSWQVWVSLRRKTKMVESKMTKMKMAAIIKLSQNE